jgi:SsrA-binding protein
MSTSTPVKIIAQNRKAHFNYAIEESIECGIVLEGTEVKSVRAGNVSYPDAFADIVGREIWLKNFHITPYVYSSIFNHDPDRPKKLLLHKDEIKRLIRKVEEKGFTLIPLDIYLKHGKIKIQLGICKGKKLFDKRSDIRDRDMKRDLQREFRKKNEG